MKNKLLLILIAVLLLSFPTTNFAQAPGLGKTSTFVLFTAGGSFTNTGASYVTGDVGTDNGAFTGFPPGTLVGNSNVANTLSAQAAADIGTAYSDLSGVTCGKVIGVTMGNSQVLTPDVYCIGAATTINDTLFLDAKGDPNALFIIKINGALATSSHAQVVLINSASLCNVYWQVNGAFTLGDSAVFRGNVIGNGAISLNTGSALYGRGLTTAGAIKISTVTAELPSACSSNSNCAPKITAAPVNQITSDGASASFSVTATGTALTYQWRKGTTDLSNTGNVSGATSATLTLNPVDISDTAYNYNVVISGTCSPGVTSSNVSLTINNAPNISTEPANQAVCDGTAASFSVVATGVGLTYQWRKGTTDINDGGNISGATSATLKFGSVTVSDVASDYNVVISGTYSPVATSTNVSLTVNTAPSITTEPVDQLVFAGVSAIFSVTATGSGLTYQWRKGTTNVSNGGNISGATTATLTIGSVTIADIATDYNVVISGTCLPNDTSVNVSLDINLNIPPAIITQPADQVTCSGNSVNFSVTATGAGLSYQWRKGTANLSNGGNISGATSATLTINPATVSDVASDYNVVINGTFSPAVTSINVSLTVNTAPKITAGPVNQAVCGGNSASFSVIATGTALTYQWKKGTADLADGGNISGATSATLTIGSVTLSDVASDYHVVVSGTCLPIATSANVSLTLSIAPRIVTQPITQMATNKGTISISVVATGTGLSYQWRKGTVNLVDGGNISGATTATLTINPVTKSDTAYNYNVVITGTCSPVLTSNDVTLFVCVCPSSGINSLNGNTDAAVSIYPNPFTTSINIILNDASQMNSLQADEIRIYNVMGELVMQAIITNQLTTLETGDLPSGIYSYQVISNDKTIQSGKLISQ